MNYELTHLRTLEAESIHIIREVAAEFERPCLLFSGGKDSVVMMHLAIRAFAPAKLPFPLMHVDTGHNFDELIEFRDRTMGKYGLRLIVASVQDAIDAGKVVEEKGPRASRNLLQTQPLLEGIESNKFTAVFGGARRDEEKARAKERVYSFRDDFGQWDPKSQRPELWSLYNSRINQGEHIRVFPISNWTEMDIWQYLQENDIEVPSLYFAHERKVFERDGMLMSKSPYIPNIEGEASFVETVRYRTIGDVTCTAAVKSSATDYEAIIAEVSAARITERGASRADDKRSEAAMEDRKREGYF